MKNKDKELLLECLSAMLPHNVECLIGENALKNEVFQYFHVDRIEVLKGIKIDDDGEVIYNFGNEYIPQSSEPYPIDVYSSEVKPCLRPISTISDEEKKELSKYVGATIMFDLMDGLYIPCICENTIYNWQKVIKWLNSKHFDTFGAVKRGIAIGVIEKKGKKIYIENGIQVKF